MKFSKAEVDAIIEASPRTFVPFNKLELSEEHQARSATTPAMSLPELAASIKDSGVLQNLVVVQAARGRYEVCAGGRRLAALTLLVQQDEIADNYPVPVLVVPADKAFTGFSDDIVIIVGAALVSTIVVVYLVRALPTLRDHLAEYA